MLSDPVLVITLLSKALDGLGIAHFIGGSVASSTFGIPRATQDADIVADLCAHDVPPLVGALKEEFYVDEGMALDAVQRRASFNVIHFETLFKADIFVLKDDLWSREEVRRCRVEKLGSEPDAWSVRIASPEDTILHKLEWFRIGGAISDRQWGDVQGVLKVQAKDLDLNHLYRWAGELGLSDLLQKALAESGILKK